MIGSRIIVFSISWVVLSASLVYSKNVNSTEARGIHPKPPALQELDLRPQRPSGLWLQAVPVSAASIEAQDLSSYRAFQFGMGLAAVAKLAHVDSSEAKVIHQRPAVIQELKWQPELSLNPSPHADPVRNILFSFYNGELFRIVVNYDRFKTQGLTTEDVIEAISSEYGTATKPAAEITFSSSHVYNDSEVIIARWEDALYSINLFRSSYQPSFGMVAFSKRLDSLARAAVVEAIRLEEQEAPQREIERQRKADDEVRAAQQKARAANKPNFRP